MVPLVAVTVGSGCSAVLGSLKDRAEEDGGIDSSSASDSALQTESLPERDGGKGDSASGAEVSDGGTEADSGPASECSPGDARACAPYPYTPAIPDETTCTDGGVCTSPCKNGTQVCVVPDGSGPQWGPCEGAVGPAAADTCTPGNDDNCNGVPNEGCHCVDGATESCGAALGALGACAGGTTTCIGGAWGACSVSPAKSDSCSVPGDDSNCNGLQNDSCPCTAGQTATCGAKLGAKGACAVGTATCNASGTGWTCSVQPATDTCVPGNDGNCDGIANDPPGGCACLNGASQACGMALGLKGPCASGTTMCAAGAWGACSVAPSADTCDKGNDNNCDGIANDPPGGCVCVNANVESCSAALGAEGACASGSSTCARGKWGACSVQPSPDSCDPGNDNSCNGVSNEGCSCLDGTKKTCGAALGAKGACAAGNTTCTAGAWAACTVQPAAADTCDSGNDANCDGVPNENCTCIDTSTATCASALGAKGACASGTTTCSGGAWGGCSVHPAPSDTCDPGNDANCDGVANEGCACPLPAGNNLVTNGGIDKNVAGFTSVDPTNLQLSYSSFDSLSCASSGSMLVENTNPQGENTAFLVCVPITAGQAYSAGANVYVASGQPRGQIFVSLNWFTSANCTGTLTTAQLGEADSPTNTWNAVRFSDLVAPAGTLSATFQGSAIKNLPAAQNYDAYFDDIYVTAGANSGF
jgi:hypothetical protein